MQIYRPMSFIPPRFAGKFEDTFGKGAQADAIKNRCIKQSTLLGTTKEYMLDTLVNAGANTHTEAEEIFTEILVDHYTRNKDIPANTIAKAARDMIPEDVLKKLPPKFVSKRKIEELNPFSSSNAKKPKTTPGHPVGLGIDLGTSEALTQFYRYSQKYPSSTGNAAVAAFQKCVDFKSLTSDEKKEAAKYHEDHRRPK